MSLIGQCSEIGISAEIIGAMSVYFSEHTHTPAQKNNREMPLVVREYSPEESKQTLLSDGRRLIDDRWIVVGAEAPLSPLVGSSSAAAAAAASIYLEAINKKTPTQRFYTLIYLVVYIVRGNDYGSCVSFCPGRSLPTFVHLFRLDLPTKQ